VGKRGGSGRFKLIKKENFKRRSIAKAQSEKKERSSLPTIARKKKGDPAREKTPREEYLNQTQGKKREKTNPAMNGKEESAQKKKKRRVQRL